MAEDGGGPGIGARLFAQGLTGGAVPAKGADPEQVGDILTEAANSAATFLKAVIPGGSVVGQVGTVGADAGLNSPGYQSKNIMPQFTGLSGGEGFLYKLLTMLKKGGMAIQNLADGIGPIQLPEGMNYGSGMDVSPSLLGTLSPPSVGDMNISQGSGIAYS